MSPRFNRACSLRGDSILEEDRSPMCRRFNKPDNSIFEEDTSPRLKKSYTLPISPRFNRACSLPGNSFLEENRTPMSPSFNKPDEFHFRRRWKSYESYESKT